jgi:hypothetical protein
MTYNFDTKKVLGTFWAIFFTNSSGHSGADLGNVISEIRVARWFVFKPKISIWVNFGRSCNGKSWYILRPLGVFYRYWKYLMAIWYILSSIGIFVPVLLLCTKKNLATLSESTF